MLKKVWGICTMSLMLVGCGYTSNGGNYTGGGGNNCGGGGYGGGGHCTYTGQAQGVYSGTSSNAFKFESIVLPNDQFFALYGMPSGPGLFVDGMITGQGTSGNDTYAAATVYDFFNTGTIKSGSISATDTPGSSISGTLTESGTMTTFNGTALPASSFNFNTAASVSAITASAASPWTGKLLDGMTTTVTIDSSGSVSGDSSGCTFTGTVKADSSNKNFFDVSLTFGASPCAVPNQTATGIGIYYLLSDGVTHQLLAAVSAGASFGTVFFAQR